MAEDGAVRAPFQDVASDEHAADVDFGIGLAAPHAGEDAEFSSMDGTPAPSLPPVPPDAQVSRISEAAIYDGKIECNDARFFMTFHV